VEFSKFVLETMFTTTSKAIQIPGHDNFISARLQGIVALGKEEINGKREMS
jgi:hypothetical protein